ncbi:MAG: hypothetical protein UV71_C0008G0011 [Microgenomates group bacterium GW2011_GWC1_43_13]|nr:MAG: hypothetical protein UV71_C0008G0011 [Microgenomates group bacterium GW2011_GWC1_43_13]OGM84979.1 MAG: hypothetical protein A2421_03365 [Candidatus Woesebacteria bacterium RIFOXYC1_FULL_43_18]
MLKFIRKHIVFSVSMVVFLHLILLISLKFTAWPETSLWPYLMTKGWLPYRDIAIAHTPLMLVKLAIFYKIFGAGILQLKIFTWLLILFLDGIIFVIAKKLWNIKTASTAVSAFAFWQVLFDGNGLWFDLFMGGVAFVSFYFIQKKKYLLAGIFWALAFLSKQTAIWFLLPILFAAISGKRSTVKESIVKFALGVLPVISIFLLGIYLLRIFPDFWYWAVKFGIFILPNAQGQILLPDLKNLIVSAFPFLIFIPLILKTGRKNIHLLIWAVAGSLGAYPRFEYFHFQPAIPFLAIATAQFLNTFKKPDKLMRSFILIYLLGSLYLFGGFFMRNYKEGTRFYETNVSNVVTFVNYNTKVGDRIFVLNWWDNIYALTGTEPATKPWTPQLSWYMDIPGVQEKMIESLESDPPKLIIYNPYTISGLSSYVPQKVYDFVTENYRIRQRVDNLEILIKK